MNLLKAIDIWTQHIQKTFKNNNNHVYGGHQLAGFKNGSKTSEAYHYLLDQNLVKDVKELAVENIDDVFYASLFALGSKPSALTDNIYAFIEQMCIREPDEVFLITKKANETQKKEIKRILAEASDEFIQSSINQNPTRTRSQTAAANNSNNNLEMSVLESFKKILDEKLNQFKIDIGLEEDETKKAYVDCDLEELKQIFKARTIRLLKHENDVKIIEKHKLNKTAPKALFIARFPRPFLPHNSDCVKNHDQMVKGMQVQFMDFNKTMLNQEIESITEDVEVIKSTILEKTNDEELTKSICASIYDSEMKNLKEDFDKSMQKAISVYNNKQDITNEQRIFKSNQKRKNNKNNNNISKSFSSNNSSIRSINNETNSKRNFSDSKRTAPNYHQHQQPQQQQQQQQQQQKQKQQQQQARPSQFPVVESIHTPHRQRQHQQ